MSTLLLFLLFPIICPLLMKKFFPHQIQWVEVAVQAAFICILCTALYFFGFYKQAEDYNILNSYVTETEVHKFDCPTNTLNPCTNGYTCNCRTVTYTCTRSDGKRTYVSTCTRIECDTCYKYSWEKNYWVHSPLDKWKIPRIDEQGANAPPRFAEVKLGDPVSVVREYDNWLLASDRSLHTNDGLNHAHVPHIPAYPIAIYDFYKVDRILSVNQAVIPDPKHWNIELSKILSELGPKKEANVIIIFSKNMTDDFAYSVRRVWKAFKKNDIVLFINLNNSDVVDWVRVMSWAKSDIFNVSLRDAVYQQLHDKKIDSDAMRIILNSISENTFRYFERKPMKEFEYLKDDVIIPTSFIVWLTIISIFGSLLLSYIFYRIDLVQNHDYSYRALMNPQRFEEIRKLNRLR